MAHRDFVAPWVASAAMDASSGVSAEEADVLRANRRFYEAFEASDLDAMSDVWEHSERVACTHPGWSTLHGWAAVASSWYALFTGPQRLQFIVTGAQAHLSGAAAWVTCEEDLLSGGEVPGVGGTVAALNLFVRDGSGRWAMVAHHGSPVVSR